MLATSALDADARAARVGGVRRRSIGVVGIGAFYRALAIGTMGVVGPITATAAIVPVAYALARGERPSTMQGVGVGLAVVGVIAASLEHVPERAARRFGVGVGLA